MPNFRPNVLYTEGLSATAKQVLYGAIRIALQKRSTSLNILTFAEFYQRVGLPASTTQTQLIELMNEARQALALFEIPLQNEDDFDTPGGSTPVFSGTYIIGGLIGFALTDPLYMLSENDLNSLIDYDA